MAYETEDFSINCISNTQSKISGILRLPTPKEYEEVLKDISDDLSAAADAGKIYTIDITELSFLNSSGITSFARLILLARSKKSTLVFKGKESIPWQKKSILSLTKLWEKLEIQLT
jgi:hypothetical protein